jgi:putative Flp pilus-assembly TadE/G-like protein
VIARVRNDERGQAILVTVLFLTVLMGAVALTLDVGVWYREQRQAQATADAAALAGAQDLPANTLAAYGSAQQYATANGGGVVQNGITFRSDYAANDTVSVSVTRKAPGIFASVFSITSVDVSAHASARAGVPEQVAGVAPIVVNKLHPMLSGPGCPCFKAETTIPLDKQGAPGAFGMVDLDGGSNNGASTLAVWISNGFDGYLPLGKYDSDPGAKFNSNGIKQALDSRLGTELLFPVFDTLTGNGSNAQYNVIGWVAFHLDCVGLQTATTDCINQHGNNQSLTGYFTRVIWNGLQAKTNKHLPDFGVYSVSLVN